MTEKEIADKLSIPEDVIGQRLERLSDSRQKVLIVDDELDTLTATRLVLEAEGYNVVTAEDGPKAIEMVGSENPDIILLDLMMPGMGG